MKTSFKKIVMAAFTAGLTAAVINSVLFFVFRALGVITDEILIQNNQPLTVLPVVISSLVPSLLAGVVYYLLARYTRNGYKIFSIITIILLLASFANPFLAIPAITISMGVALCIMHVVVVVSLLYFFNRINRTEGKPALS